MRDELEHFFEEHGDDFDVHQPPANLWQRLNKQLRPAQRRTYRWYIAAAASVAFLFGVCTWLARPGVPEVAGHDVVDVTVAPELKEAVAYYASMVETKRNELSPFGTRYPDLFKDFSTEMDTLHVLYRQLVAEYKASDGNEAVSQALIENLQMQVQLLSKQLQIIQSLKNKGLKKNSKPKLI